ncbi:response regulator [Azospirillum sp. SYSU D00513]|uniref:response regulator n=1 Tax=Azospirillum sp. SYSU D00513 TaxID=2812561 RepID=UPI001A965F37|nr:response regulator [Azospirillum sp. SYSU D00513]
MRVLIVDDEMLIAMHLELLVTQMGHEVCALATDAEEALAAAARCRPTIALMDVRLARGSSGVDAAYRLRQEFGIRCIFVSASLDDGVRASLRPLEPLGFVGKPIMPATIMRALEKADATTH